MGSEDILGWLVLMIVFLKCIENQNEMILLLASVSKRKTTTDIIYPFYHFWNHNLQHTRLQHENQLLFFFFH